MAIDWGGSSTESYADVVGERDFRVSDSLVFFGDIEFSGDVEAPLELTSRGAFKL